MKFCFEIGKMDISEMQRKGYHVYKRWLGDKNMDIITKCDLNLSTNPIFVITTDDITPLISSHNITINGELKTIEYVDTYDLNLYSEEIELLETSDYYPAIAQMWKTTMFQKHGAEYAAFEEVFVHDPMLTMEESKECVRYFVCKDNIYTNDTGFIGLNPAIAYAKGYACDFIEKRVWSNSDDYLNYLNANSVEIVWTSSDDKKPNFF